MKDELSAGQKADVEKLLEDGKTGRIYPRGYSMYPLFVPGRDAAVLAPADTEKLSRGDVVLYRREGSILVMHRIWKRKGDDFYMVGDNQKEIEGPLQARQIKGVLIEIVRNKKSIPAEQPVYRLLSGLWLWLRPWRPLLSKTAAGVKKMIRRIKCKR